MANNEYEHYADLFRGMIAILRNRPTVEANREMTAICFKMLMKATGITPNSDLDIKYHYLLSNPMIDVAQAFDDVGLELISKVEGNFFVFTVNDRKTVANYQIKLPFTAQLKSLIPINTTVH